MWKQFFHNYFEFTLKERKGVIIIITLILLCILLPFFYPLFIQQRKYNYSEFESEINRLTTEKKDSDKTRSYTKKYSTEMNDDNFTSSKTYEVIKAETFYFDPNSATPDDWKRLGLRDKTIHTIQNYLSKGGKFYKPEDITKIWGLSPADAQRLIPYVSIKNETKENTSFEKKEYPKTSVVYTAKTPVLIDVNSADTSAFISLPGIGNKLANRIISFRDKLGGFYSVNQVGETYMLSDSTFQKIKPRLIIYTTAVKQININIASVDEMKIHPYIRYAIANAIFQYRQQHGNYNTVDDIKKIATISDEIFTKLSPYLTTK